MLAELRQRVDSQQALRLPDAPPLTTRESSAIFLHLADGVDEGYAATYAQTGGRDLGVWAVRLAHAPDAGNGFPIGEDRNVRVIDIGSIRAAVLGDDSACSAAIETCLKQLGR